MASDGITTCAWFVSTDEDAVLSGDVDLPVQGYSSHGLPSSLFFDINDGEWYRPVYPEPIEWVEPGTPVEWTVELGIPTQLFPNGAHRLFLIVYQNQERHIVAQKTVTFSNEIQNVGIRGWMGAGEMSCPVTATLTTSQPWTVEIRRNMQSVVRSWSGDGETINVSWDGNDQDGKPVMGGSLRAVIKALQSGETVGEKIQYLIINLNRW